MERISIPHNRLSLGPEEEDAALRVLRSGWLAQGQEVEQFEDEFCRFVGLPEGSAVAVSSGTAALFLALWALGSASKLVAFPAYTCSSLRHATAMAGATEKLLDIVAATPNVDLQQLQLSGADIAIIPHMYGLPVDVSQIKSVEVIEDCAQALGAKTGGISVGLRGRLGVFSFYATKLMTSGGQGGMVVSQDRSLITAIKDFREFDQRPDQRKRFNLQMTDLSAAIGREQLRKLPGFLERREQIFEDYRGAGLDLLDVSHLSGVSFKPVRYRAVLRTDAPEKVIEGLARSGIRAIVPLQEWELLGEPAKFPKACQLSLQTVSLPIYPSLSERDVERVIHCVREITGC